MYTECDDKNEHVQVFDLEIGWKLKSLDKKNFREEGKLRK